MTAIQFIAEYTTILDEIDSLNLSFMFSGLMRVLKPGRVAIVHVCQIPRMKRSGGYVSRGGKSPKTNKAIQDQRSFYGCELKQEYHSQAVKNIETAMRHSASDKQQDLFAEVAT